jgi:hypothetical protein
MKKVLFSLLAVGLATVSFAQTKVADVAKFKAEVIDMGKIQVGNPTTAVFQVQNIGKTPLIIEAANPTCGCTIGDYTKSPIIHGKNGEIKATYNAAGIGVFEKHLTVKFAGVDEIKSITIKGEVLSAEDFAKLPAGKQKVKPTPASTKKVKVAKAATAKTK